MEINMPYIQGINSTPHLPYHHPFPYPFIKVGTPTHGVKHG